MGREETAMGTEVKEENTAMGGAAAKRRSIFARRTDLDLTNGPIFKTILLFALA